jgi:hypothetical protein
LAPTRFIPAGQASNHQPSGYFLYDNLLYPSVDPGIDLHGLLFIGNGFEINIFSKSASILSIIEFYDDTGYNYTAPTGPPSP